jgi:hypothetical protein
VIAWICENLKSAFGPDEQANNRTAERDTDAAETMSKIQIKRRLRKPQNPQKSVLREVSQVLRTVGIAEN